MPVSHSFDNGGCDWFFYTRLIAAIGGLGWTVPQSGYTAGREWGRDKACAACFEELRKHVGPHGKRIIEAKVLKNGMSI